ncbi:transposase family protein [Caballeronia calidae]|uniref:transposase family protein n=1 Tax=Caballeronia calidae TaxID=1777139 RepID=UPI000941473C|nr:transposase family protein [Caballeronia calidae]
MQGVLSIEEAFASLDDPCRHSPVHGLSEILASALCAILCGAHNWVAVQVRGEEKLDWLSPPHPATQRHPIARYLRPGVRRA